MTTMTSDLTEQNIREAFEKYCEANPFKDSFSEADFRAGYLALLNELESTSLMGFDFYRLPEGVTK